MAKGVGAGLIPVPVDELSPAAVAKLQEKGWSAEMQPEEVALLIQVSVKSTISSTNTHARSGLAALQEQSSALQSFRWVCFGLNLGMFSQKWLAEDFKQGGAGCDPTYPIYSNVREYLEEEGFDKGLQYARL